MTIPARGQVLDERECHHDYSQQMSAESLTRLFVGVLQWKKKIQASKRERIGEEVASPMAELLISCSDTTFNTFTPFVPTKLMLFTWQLKKLPFIQFIKPLICLSPLYPALNTSGRESMSGI